MPGNATADVLKEFISVIRRGCMRCVPDGNDYPPLNREVQAIVAALSMTPRILQSLWRTFQHLRSFDPLTLNTTAEECSTQSVIRLVRYKREYVSKILAVLLELGGYKEIIDWNGFLYVMLKLCTLSKLELGQVLFYVICRDMQSWTVHYITTTQLQEFYDDYADCPVRSFNTSNIGFSSLPMAKYSMVEFIQLIYRYSQLINPFLHLQRSLQQTLPNLAFWNDYDRVKLLNRRVTLDFFRVSKVKTLTDLVLGAHHQRQQEEEEAMMPEQMRMEEEAMLLDPKSRIKRLPGVEADMPIPLSMHEWPVLAPGPPGFVPLRTQAQKRKVAPPLPAWMDEKMALNTDPVTGVPMGVTAAKMVPPNWALPLTEEKTTDQVKQAILASHRPDWIAKPIQEQKAPKPSVVQAGSVVDWRRAEELDFIRKSRAYERHEVKVIDQINRVTRCELIARPEERRLRAPGIV
eukprot:TRINITY_DN21848_c0_g1_i1.p1 TRINITY_DN21848_c0_g1~~TRINITY_DN21848_c0_g1_i1.p1  ORF type:complete len:462 (+),score=110.39 TRINITY_DN21848_c0_g1_i1:160-1545(+)